MTRREAQNVWRWGVLAALAVLAIDQATKVAALTHEQALSSGVEVLPFMNFVLIRNTGVSFGMFAAPPELGQWPVILMTTSIIVGLAVWLSRIRDCRQAAAIGTVIGGGLGNLIDRFRHGAVTDFLDFHYGTRHWPAFNLADTLIVLGVAGLLLTSARSESAPKPP